MRRIPNIVILMVLLLNSWPAEQITSIQAAALAPFTSNNLQTTFINLATNDLQYDPINQKLYASVPSEAGPSGNSIVPIELDGTLGAPIWVGSQPNAVAIADDGSYLYVGLDGSGSVGRVNLDTQTVDLEFSLGSSIYCGPLFVDDLLVVANDPHAVVVSQQSKACSSGYEGVQIFDDGVARANAIPIDLHANRFESSDTPSIIYGYNATNSSHELYTLQLDSSGITILTETAYLLTGFTNDIYHHAGRVYDLQGHIINAVTNQLHATIPVTGQVVADSVAERIYYLTQIDETLKLETFDYNTFVLLDSQIIPHASGTPERLILVDGNTIAFTTSHNQVGIIDLSTSGQQPGISRAMYAEQPTIDLPGQFAIQTTLVDVQANHIAYDAIGQMLYASVAHSQTIVPIDLNGDLSMPITVGNNPNKLAIANDGSYLYVGIDGAAAVRRVDLTTLTPDLQFSIGTEICPNPTMVEDMFVLVDDPHAVAVSRKAQFGCSPNHQGVAIFDDGVMRPKSTDRFARNHRIEPASDPTLIYGHDSETTAYGFRKMAIDSSGLTVLSTTKNLIYDFYQDIHYHAGRIYVTSGHVIDADKLQLLAKLPAQGPVVADSLTGRIYYVTYQDSVATLKLFDDQTFALIGQAVIPDITGSSTDVLLIDQDTLVVRTSTNQVALVDVSITRDVFLQASTSSPDVEAESTGIQVTLDSNLDTSTVLTTQLAWGDGTVTEPLTLTAPFLTALDFQHVYSATGRYTATLIVTASNGLVHSLDLPILVYVPKTATLETSTPDTLQETSYLTTTFEIADLTTATDEFTYTVDWGDPSQEVFTATTAPTITSYLSHTYQAVGNYPITVTSYLLPDVPQTFFTSIVVQELVNPDMVSTTIIDLPARDLAYDRTGQKLYASLNSRYGPTGNSVMPINLNGEFGIPISVGSEPHKLAVSANNEFLYVGINGSASAGRIALTSQVKDLEFSLGNGRCGAQIIDDMFGLKDNPHSIAVLLAVTKCRPIHEDVVIFDDGIARPNTVFNVSLIEPSDEPSTMYGYANNTTNYPFSSLNINNSGVNVASTVTRVFNEAGLDMSYHAGRMYLSNGTVFDPDTVEILAQLDARGLVGADTLANRIYYLTGSGAAIRVKVFNQNTFAYITDISIAGVSGTPKTMVMIDKDSFAFTTSDEQIVIVHLTIPEFLEIAASSTSPDPISTTTTLQATIYNPTESTSGLTYTVDWGDGTVTTPATTTAPLTTVVELEHIYPQLGVYTATLTVTASETIVKQDQVPISIYRPLTIALDASSPDTLGQTSVVTALFNLQDSDIATTQAFSYTIDWGDGASAIMTATTAPTVTQVLTHTYQAAGEYPVQLTVASDMQPTATTTITVESLVDPRFTFFVPYLRRP